VGAPGVTTPSRSKMLLRGFTGRCAICGSSRLTRTWIRLEPRCKRCNFPIERNEGHFVGAVGMNTIVTFGAILITVLIGAGLTAPDIPVGKLSVITVAVGLGVSVFFFPISKTLWSAVDAMMVDLKPGEVDPRYDPSVDISA
jgi:uncharacterized protein (DUF983 family)